MTNVLEDGTHIVKSSDLGEFFFSQWVGLFQRCFGGSKEKATRVFQKYKLNDSRICCLMKNGTMVAAYCGLKFKIDDGAIFLSTDTMSDGTKKGASVVLGKQLYSSLVSEEVYVVCGYPNNNIRKIRERGLGWTISGYLYLYVGIPFVWRFLRRVSKDVGLWKVLRPTSGWYTRTKPLLFELLGRNGLYSNQLGFAITLSAYRPGSFFIKVPEFLFETRTFGYKFLTEDVEKKNAFLNKMDILDLDTIDIP